MIEEATVNVWVAVEGGAVTRAEYVGDFTSADDSGVFGMTYDLLSRDAPVEIGPPANCPG